MASCTVVCVVVLLLAAVAAPLTRAASPTPVVLMHGLMATSEAISHVAGWIKSEFPAIYVHNVALHNGTNKLFSLLTPLKAQAALFASVVRADPKLAGGFHAIGHSQGGLVTRAYVQYFAGRGGYPAVRNLISLAGPQDGVYGVPDLNYYCNQTSVAECDFISKAFSMLMDDPSYSYAVQDVLTFASYWKNILNYTDYVQRNVFLADLNNERTINESYRSAITSLQKYILVEALLDRIVVPPTSPWFQFYANGTTASTVPFLQSAQYTGNLLGLRTLYAREALYFASVQCGHQGMVRDECKNVTWPIVRKYINQ